MACKPPMRPKSTPYWNGQRTMMPQAMKHLRWAFHDSSLFDAISRSREGCSWVNRVVSMLGGTPGSAVKCRTESMQGGEVKDEKRNRLQRALADAPPRTYYIPMLIWSLLAINMGHAMCSSAFTPRTPFSNLGKRAKCRSKLGCHEYLANRQPMRRRVARFADGW